MTGSGPADPRIHPASTVVLLHDGPHGPETFMVRRHEASAFLGGAHVFPGGRVDAADRSADASWCDGLAEAARALPGLAAGDAVAHYVAAVRELFEESGVLLARNSAGRFAALDDAEDHGRTRHLRTDLHEGRASLRDVALREGWRVALDALVPFARWVTPPVDVRRFDTVFFAARLPPRQTPLHDPHETTHGEWMSPHEAIGRAVRDAIALPVPTWTTMRELEPFASTSEVIAWARQAAVVRREPRFLERNGTKWLLLPGDPENGEPGLSPPRYETRFALRDRQWRAVPSSTYNPAGGSR